MKKKIILTFLFLTAIFGLNALVRNNTTIDTNEEKIETKTNIAYCLIKCDDDIVSTRTNDFLDGFVGAGAAVAGGVGVIVGGIIVNEITKGNNYQYSGSSSNNNDSSSEQEKSGEKEDIPETDLSELPENVRETYEKYKKHGWKGNLPGTNGKMDAGGKWENKKNQLPTETEDGEPITYKEYDVNEHESGKNRDNERFVRGSDGSVYYTDSHYGDGESKYGLPPFVRVKKR